MATTCGDETPAFGQGAVQCLPGGELFPIGYPEGSFIGPKRTVGLLNMYYNSGFLSAVPFMYGVPVYFQIGGQTLTCVDKKFNTSGKSLALVNNPSTITNAHLFSFELRPSIKGYECLNGSYVLRWWGVDPPTYIGITDEYGGEPMYRTWQPQNNNDVDTWKRVAVASVVRNGSPQDGTVYLLLSGWVDNGRGGGYFTWTWQMPPVDWCKDDDNTGDGGDCYTLCEQVSKQKSYFAVSTYGGTPNFSGRVSINLTTKLAQPIYSSTVDSNQPNCFVHIPAKFKMYLYEIPKNSGLEIMCDVSVDDNTACEVDVRCVGDKTTCALRDTPAGFLACQKTLSFLNNTCTGGDLDQKINSYASCKSIAGIKPTSCIGLFSEAQPAGANFNTLAYACANNFTATEIDGRMNAFCNNFLQTRECSCIKRVNSNEPAPTLKNICGTDGNVACTYSEFIDKIGSALAPQLQANPACWWPPCMTDEPAYKPSTMSCGVDTLVTCINNVAAATNATSQATYNINNNCSASNIYYNPVTGSFDTPCTDSERKYGCTGNGTSGLVCWGEKQSDTDVKCWKKRSPDNACVNEASAPQDAELWKGNGTYASQEDCVNEGGTSVAKWGCDASGIATQLSAGTKANAADVRCYKCVSNACVLRAQGDGTFGTLQECQQSGQCEIVEPPPAPKSKTTMIVVIVVVIVVLIIIGVVIGVVVSKKKRAQAKTK